MATVSLKNLSDKALADREIFFLFSKIIFLPNQLLAINLSAHLDGFIRQ